MPFENASCKELVKGKYTLYRTRKACIGGSLRLERICFHVCNTSNDANKSTSKETTPFPGAVVVKALCHVAICSSGFILQIASSPMNGQKNIELSCMFIPTWKIPVWLIKMRASAAIARMDSLYVRKRRMDTC